MTLFVTFVQIKLKVGKCWFLRWDIQSNWRKIFQGRANNKLNPHWDWESNLSANSTAPPLLPTDIVLSIMDNRTCFHCWKTLPITHLCSILPFCIFFCRFPSKEIIPQQRICLPQYMVSWTSYIKKTSAVN